MEAADDRAAARHEDENYEARLNTVGLAGALPTLDEQEQLVVRRYFFDEMTQTEIAEELGVSQMQVFRLLARSLGRLRRSV